VAKAIATTKTDELLNNQDLYGDELDGLDGLGETWPIIQWVNDPKALSQRPDSKRGGFIMTAEHMELAGDFPKGAMVNTIEFGASDDNPDGIEVDCVYTPALTFVPLGKRSAWFAGPQRLPRDFDWDAVVEKYGKNPRSKLQIHALVQGDAGPFLARVTFSSTVAKDGGGALQSHNRNVQVALKKAGIKNKALKLNGWRWFWTTFAAQESKMRGDGEDKSKVTPVGLHATGEYLGTDLREQYFDVDEIKAFEDMWKREVEAIEAVAAPGIIEPEFPPDDSYDNDIPF